MATYQDIRRQIENLTPDEQLRLLAKPKRSIMELEGLGKQAWRGLDAQEYVNQERASWNG
jgi:hypothetical protein